MFDDLAVLLERHGEALQTIPGVVGVGIGASGPGSGEEQAIHVYVEPPADREAVRHKVRLRLHDTPFEVIAIEPPRASDESTG